MPKINMNLLSPSPTTFEYARKIHCKFVYFSNLKKKWLDCYSGFSVQHCKRQALFYSLWFILDFPFFRLTVRARESLRIKLHLIIFSKSFSSNHFAQSFHPIMFFVNSLLMSRKEILCPYFQFPHFPHPTLPLMRIQPPGDLFP